MNLLEVNVDPVRRTFLNMDNVQAFAIDESREQIAVEFSKEHTIVLPFNQFNKLAFETLIEATLCNMEIK